MLVVIENTLFYMGNNCILGRINYLVILLTTRSKQLIY